MQVTIEGVVQSDVCDRGARHTVEWTDHLRNLVRTGLIRVVEWHHTPATPTGGTFTLSSEDGAVTLPYDAPQAEIDTAVETVAAPKRRSRKPADA